ncbi:hypothetical protein ACFZ8E_07505 [Methylobacterium sp. HMF5984]|uniref:hypothetical protein n=1 Tax=Methylobacterium sp. HMF5984 TaxID=3367370 RepID=UPI0038543E7A
MTEAELRQKLATNFAFYAENFVKIRTKDGEIRNFKLNKVQRDLLELVEAQIRTTGKVRIVILKARQQGLSTFVSAYLYWYLSHHRAKKGLVVAHVAKSTQSLFDMYRRVHGDMDKRLKPSTSYAGRTELFFDKLDTALAIATAGGDGIARGETITHAHLSEVAFWPKGSAHENLNALMQAIPGNKETVVFAESTANGVSGPFYDLWNAAVNGTNGFIPFFSPWYDSAEYTIDGPVIPPMQMTVEEVDLAARGVSNGQLLWRRQKIAQNGRDAFMQEYPSSADEAFLTSGSPIFSPSALTDLMANAKDIITRERFTVENEWIEDSRGELFLYHDYDKASTYYIGADVSQGTGRDFSVAQILDEDKRQVAIWRGKVDPFRFADILCSLGERFNFARIIVENNSMGFGCAAHLGTHLHYDNIYYTMTEGKANVKETKTFGFRTSAQTKPMIVAGLQEAIRMGEIEINDRITLSELQTYITTDSGRMEAESNCWDDTVMSLCLANYVHTGKVQPINVTDEYYVRAI